MATITLDKTTIKAGETAVVTFTVEKTHFMGTLNRSGVRTVNDVTITGGTISAGYDFRYVEALSTPTTQVYQGTFTPTPNLDRTECRISYDPPGTANDATSATFIVDTRAPTLTGTPTIGNPNLTRANQVTTITFVFSEQLDQASFTTADLTIPAGMGTLENLRTTDGGRSWQVDLRASANLAANTEAKDLQIGINMAGITDVAGNAGTGNVNLVTYTIDNKPPSATIAVTTNPVKNSNDRLVTVTITFDEAVTGFTADNIDFSNANVTPYGTNRIGTLNRSADGRTYTITYTASPETEDATNTVSLRNIDTIRDAAGNAATVSPTSNNFAIDTKAPYPTSATFDKTHLAAGETATVTVTFNEIVNNVTEDTFQIPNGSVSNLRQDTTDGRIWRATFTPTANLPSTSSSISINLNGLRDSARNVKNGSQPFDQSTTSIDTKRPEATVAISDTRLTVGETATVTFTFSERVTGFVGSDNMGFEYAQAQYDRSKGTLGAPTAVGTDGKVWTATYTPLTDIESAENTISVNLSDVRDAQGNAGEGTGTSGNFSIDTKRPEVTVTISDNRLTAGESATVTFTFSESVTGFGTEDIQYDTSKGTLGALTAAGTDGKVWTATYTPRPDTESANNTIRVNLAGVRDAQGNAGSGIPSSGNFSIDTVRPTVNVTISDNRLTAGESATITITFNERVTGFTKEAIDLSQANGTLGDLTAVGTDGKVWTATFTPTANLARTTNHRLTLNLANVRNAAGNTVANNTYAFNQYTVDTMVFALSSATANRDQLVLSYSDETALDGNADRAPTNESFTVLVDGTRIDVSRVTVDAAARTVTPTLARAVTTGQQVTVAYQDTDTSDNKALQEAGTGANGGDDAASFAARAVTNLTQSPVAPATPDGSNGPDALDSDRDGLSNNQEDLATGLLRPDGSAGMAGDGNGDGIKDSRQAAVASNRDLTLVAGSQDGKLRPDSNAHITELVRSDAPAHLPKGMEMPIGLTSFKADLSEGRSTESFSLYVDPALGVNGYWLKNSAGTWVNLASEPYGGKVASEGGRMRLDFLIQDGGQYDADGQVNGSISAPGAVAKMPLSIVGQMPDSHSFGFWY